MELPREPITRLLPITTGEDSKLLPMRFDVIIFPSDALIIYRLPEQSPVTMNISFFSLMKLTGDDQA